MIKPGGVELGDGLRTSVLGGTQVDEHPSLIKGRSLSRVREVM